MLADKRDQRDPTTLGQQILAMKGKTAHEKADKVLGVSMNGKKPWQGVPGLVRHDQ
jgi:hypothetical protein